MAKWCLSLALVGLTLAGRGHARLSDVRAVAPGDAQASNVYNVYREVRLRKMHQVRPDLIPYPIDIAYYA